MNILTEYQKRHNNNTIPICHNGLCFFNLNGVPSLVALTSLPCRSYGTCPKCRNRNDSIILELFESGIYGKIVHKEHKHINPCDNLQIENYEPVFVKNSSDLELWLWEYCTKGHKIRGLKSQESDNRLKIIEQMVYASANSRKLYNAYLFTYEAFIPSRKYLLYK